MFFEGPYGFFALMKKKIREKLMRSLRGRREKSEKNNVRKEKTRLFKKFFTFFENFCPAAQDFDPVLRLEKGSKKESKRISTAKKG